VDANRSPNVMAKAFNAGFVRRGEPVVSASLRVFGRPACVWCSIAARSDCWEHSHWFSLPGSFRVLGECGCLSPPLQSRRSARLRAAWTALGIAGY
jgi:hypothetical protein